MTKSGSRNGIQIAVPVKTPSKTYSRSFARSQWRQTFTEEIETGSILVRMSPAWPGLREAGQAGSFRHFTSRTHRN